MLSLGDVAEESELCMSAESISEAKTVESVPRSGAVEDVEHVLLLSSNILGSVWNKA